MPGLSNNVKNLYIAKSMLDIETVARKAVQNAMTSASKQDLKLLDKVFQEAEAAVTGGDEERAFCLYYRYSGMCISMRKKATDLKYFDLMVGSKLKKCIEESERLSSSLVNRYALLENADNEKNHLVSESTNGVQNVNLFNGVNEDEVHVNGDLVTNNTISCIDLYEFFETELKDKKPQAPVVLIIDCRPLDDFKKSQMKLPMFLKDKSNSVVIMNIPDEMLREGLSITALEKKLDSECVKTLKCRKQAKKVILLDWHSKELTKNSSKSLSILFNAIWKWDKSADRVKTPPFILLGGFASWLNHYPVCTTDPKVAAPTESSPTKSPVYLNPIKIDASAYDLTYMDEPKPEPPNASLNGFTNGVKPEFTANNVVNNPLKTFDVEKRFNSNIASTVAPGGAKLIPSFDRKKKPMGGDDNRVASERRASEPVHGHTPDDFRRRKEQELEEEMRRSLLDQNEKKIAEEKKCVLKEGVESNSLRKGNESQPIIQPRISSTKRLNDQPDTRITSSSSINLIVNGHEPIVKPSPRDGVNLNSQTMGRPRQTDRTLSESKSNLKPSSSGLSRSYSSPNIAQLLAEEEDHDDVNSLEPSKLMKSRSSTNPPLFDRSVKPSLSSINKSLSHLNIKNRNFSPVYGIAGQAITGLKNLGNTCFMNSIIQCLSNTVELAVYFKNELHLSHINRESKFGSRGEIAEEFGMLIKQMWTCQYKNISPKDMKQVVGTHMRDFEGCEQHDAHEFLTMLLDKLTNDLNIASPSNTILNIEDLPTHLAINKFWNHHISRTASKISELVEGLTMSTLTCSTCLKKSETFEVFTSLSLPIPAGNRATLNDCLKLFSEPERMTGEAAWDCPTCKCKREATKRMQVCKLPKILVIHFKRFSYDGMWRQKLQTSIDFPLNDLSLRNYRYVNQHDSANGCYDLYGVVNHYGTMEGGHYVAFCKHASRQKWYKYDDHDVSDMSSVDVKTQAAYILFYAAKQASIINGSV